VTLAECYSSILIIDKLGISCQYTDPSFAGSLAVTNYEMRYQMHLEQDSSLLPNSAAIPLPTAPNSAAGGDAPLADKYLKKQEFLEPQRRFAGVERRFSPAVREASRTRALSGTAGVR